MAINNVIKKIFFCLIDIRMINPLRSPYVYILDKKSFYLVKE